MTHLLSSLPNSSTRRSTENGISEWSTLDSRSTIYQLSELYQAGSRFFILKSVGKSVVKSSMSFGHYSVQATVASRLNYAFSRMNPSKSIFLIVSTKKSKAYQGIGRMRSTALMEQNRCRFRFSMEWLTGFVNVPFREVEHIRQRPGSEFSVTVAQDGQEIEFRAGTQLSSAILQEEQKDFDYVDFNIGLDAIPRGKMEISSWQKKVQVKETKKTNQENPPRSLSNTLPMKERRREVEDWHQSPILEWDRLQYSIDLSKGFRSCLNYQF